VNVRRLNIGIRTAPERSKALREAMRRVSRGARKPQPSELYFESVEVLRRFLTDKRMELLLRISRDRPASIQQLAGLVGRDYKNVSADIALLGRLGLVKLAGRVGRGKPQVPTVPYDEIHVSIDLRGPAEPRAAQ
jgi:predicted transcriptional regulator